MHSMMCKTLLMKRYLTNTRKKTVKIPIENLYYAVKKFNRNFKNGIYYLWRIFHDPIKIAKLILGHNGFSKENRGELLAFHLDPESPKLIYSVKFAFINLVKLENKDICKAFHFFETKFEMPKNLRKRFRICVEFAEVYQKMNPANRTLRKLKNVLWVFAFAYWYFSEKLRRKEGMNDPKNVWDSFNKYDERISADLCRKVNLMDQYHSIFKNIFDIALEKNLNISKWIFIEWENARDEELKVKLAK